ncbi:MAG TPA: folate-binding protein [Casimicrobiaceae bacterium]|nr:folate-binding protein [Casimicrobiaceae bacterium]
MPPAPAACTHTEWGILRATGQDAVAFLHAQLSSDVERLGPGEGQYWSYNSPKGRMLANGVLWRAPEERDAGITLLVAADLATVIQKRLSMFVLRSKVTIEDASADSSLIGIAGEGAQDALRVAFGVAPARGRAVAFKAHASAFTLPDGRIVVAAPIAEGSVLEAALAPHATIVGRAEWRRFGIALGVPLITSPTSDLFVPQTANLDLLGGVSFTKGCYPGQEIVARMQYLGRLKERLFAFHADAFEAAPGTRIYSKTFSVDQSCGAVVNAAPDTAGGVALLAVVQLDAVKAGDLTLGARDGPHLTRRSLPYDVPMESEDRPRPRT